MKANKLIFLLVLVISSVNCSRISTDAEIKGKIKNPDEKVIRIGDNSVPVSENAEFSFVAKLKSPVFYEVSYAGNYWMIYIEPGKKVALKLTAGDLSSLEYEGDLKSSNIYLQKRTASDNYSPGQGRYCYASGWGPIIY